MPNIVSTNIFKKRSLRHGCQVLINRASAELKFAYCNYDLLMIPMIGLYNKIYIDPQKIKRVSIGGNSFTKRNYLFRSGDWDIRFRAIGEYETNDIRYITCRELLDGHDITETTEFKFYQDKAKNGVLDRNFKKKEDIKTYLVQVRKMYNKIYFQRSLDETEMSDPVSGRINVCVDRDGNILLQRNGHHRVAAARYLRIDRIPVFVRQMHSCLTAGLTNDGSVKGILQDVNALLRKAEADNS